MTPEHKLMNEIRLWCGEHDFLCFRCNVGTHLLADNTYFSTGLPKGFSDLLILGYGIVCFCECKVKGNKPSPEQITFLDEMSRRGFLTVVAYSVDDVSKLLQTICNT